MLASTIYQMTMIFRSVSANTTTGNQEADQMHHIRRTSVDSLQAEKFRDNEQMQQKGQTCGKSDDSGTANNESKPSTTHQTLLSTLITTTCQITSITANSITSRKQPAISSLLEQTCSWTCMYGGYDHNFCITQMQKNTRI